jgi:hypothetical protein
VSGWTLLLGVVASAVGGLALLACSARDGSSEPLDGPATWNSSAADLAGHIQRALDAKGHYVLTVDQQNLVLPQWGGVDGGVVAVGADAVLAELIRTGDGPYAMLRANGETYFKRETCTEWARVPGGGAGVLAPFVLIGNDGIAGAKGLQLLPGRTALALELPDAGKVTLRYDVQTYLPLELWALNEAGTARRLLWTFEYDTPAPALEGPTEAGRERAPDRGPGGNPC